MRLTVGIRQTFEKVNSEQKRKRPISDVRTAPRTLGWFDLSNILTEEIKETCPFRGMPMLGVA